MDDKVKTKKELVSIIVPVFNTEKYLIECVDGLVNQSYPNKEIILVDDGSKRECAELCDKIALQYSSVTVVHKQNGGVSSARNVGMKKAKGKYLYFCDSDDIPAPNLLNRLVDSIEDTNCDLSVCGYVRFKTKDEIHFSNEKDNKSVFGDERLNIAICNHRYGGYLWNKLFIKKYIDDNSLRFDESLDIIEDALFVLEYICKTHSLVVLDENLYAYRDNEFGITNSSLSQKTLTATIGQKKVFELLVKENAPVQLQKWVWRKLMQSIVVSYKKLFFSKSTMRGKWLPRLKDMFENYKLIFNIRKELSHKEIAYCILLEIT